MKREVITTADGSKTIKIIDWDEQYHSIHGAIQEANHVFIKYGFQSFLENNSAKKHIDILEIGFGTGLNALVTNFKSIELNVSVDYLGIEAFPVSVDEALELNFSEILDVESHIFKSLHTTTWDESHAISRTFTLKKRKLLFQEIDYINKFEIIYFDAFGPRVQPELWEEEMFIIMHNALKINGILVTYSAKGSVRRAMQSVGFTVERLQGPPGKREMLRAIKH